jgi:hypothetical protein
MNKPSKNEIAKWVAAFLLGLLSIHIQAADFVEISAEIESLAYGLHDTNGIARAKPKTFSVLCISAINGLEFKACFKSETANEASAALDALKEIDATNAVAILQRAMALFPDGKPPSDLVKRRELVEQLGTRANFWIDCNADYFYDNITVCASIVAHARKMRAEIVAP